MGEIQDEGGADSYSIARRRVLKGAVAAGVGAAAWGAPHIRTLGTVPAAAGPWLQQINPTTSAIVCRTPVRRPPTRQYRGRDREDDAADMVGLDLSLR